jgi:hypothetical protein
MIFPGVKMISANARIKGDTVNSQPEKQHGIYSVFFSIHLGAPRPA